MAGYLIADKSAHGELTKKECEGKIPLLLQWDRRWGYVSYGSSDIGLSGCAPTCLSMVIVGLTGNRNATPDKIAEYAQENGYYLKGTGKIKVNDPNCIRRSCLWDYEVLEPQIKNLWAYCR